jgi:hypothetical protein
VSAAAGISRSTSEATRGRNAQEAAAGPAGRVCPALLSQCREISSEGTAFRVILLVQARNDDKRLHGRSRFSPFGAPVTSAT